MYNKRHENMDETRRKGREEQRLFRQRNKDKVNAKGRIRRAIAYWSDVATSRLKGREKYKRQMATNPQPLRDKGIRNNAKRKAILLGTATSNNFTTQDVEAHLKMQKGKCWWCGKKLKGKYHVDHRIPLSRGGDNSARNICISCPSCNTSKNDNYITNIGTNNINNNNNNDINNSSNIRNTYTTAAAIVGATTTT